MAMPAMTAVISSNIARVGYDESTSELYVEFKSGGTYVYLHVPSHVFAKFLGADSKGRYLNVVIKPAYRCLEL
jgi:hypothetical protein